MTAPATDVVAQARKDGAWIRDYVKNCRCPWTWNAAEQRWERSEGATCNTHRWGQ